MKLLAAVIFVLVASETEADDDMDGRKFTVKSFFFCRIVRGFFFGNSKKLPVFADFFPELNK